MVESRRIREIGDREASLLSNGIVRVMVDDRGGMVPELSFKRAAGFLNTHWIPYFRDTSGEPYDEGRHGGFWGGGLLYGIAGNFPCLPNFGPPASAYQSAIDPHGTTANGLWRFEGGGTVGDRAAYAVTTLEGSDLTDLAYRKVDLVLAGQPVHYTLLSVRNRGSVDYRINAAWHNTIAPPFLESGCLIDLSADRFATPPAPSEFDDTGRLETGAEFDDLTRAPLRAGSTIDARLVPGMVGYTDLITGAVPAEATLGWSAVVNPGLGALYLCFFKGPSGGESEIRLQFNDLWLQYGGRRFTPWAAADGGSDLTLCLGTENSVGAFANGLDYSLAHPELLGRPTTVEVPAGGERRLYYATLASPYEEGVLDQGVARVEPASGGIAVVGRGSRGAAQEFSAEAEFSAIEELVAQITV